MSSADNLIYAQNDDSRAIDVQICMKIPGKAYALDGSTPISDYHCSKAVEIAFDMAYCAHEEHFF